MISFNLTNVHGSIDAISPLVRKILSNGLIKAVEQNFVPVVSVQLNTYTKSVSATVASTYAQHQGQLRITVEVSVFVEELDEEDYIDALLTYKPHMFARLLDGDTVWLDIEV